MRRRKIFTNVCETQITYLGFFLVHTLLAPIMRAVHFFAFSWSFVFCQCADFGSYEVNQIEVSPMYDMILFNDIADVIKDFANDLSSAPEAKSLAESDSNENIDDLLMEYQHYLDKAHKQHVDYLDRVRGKNKVPLLRGERYPKLKGLKNNMNQFFHPFTLPQTIYPNVQSTHDYNTMFSYLNKSSRLNTLRNTPPSCYCKNSTPCNCGCKQCFVQIDSTNFDDKSPTQYKDPFLRDTKYDNDIKIRMKVDIKLPKMLEKLVNIFSKRDQGDLDATNYIAPYLNPRDVLGFNSMPGLSESIPLHRIIIHKKKKIHPNSNKKHRMKISNVHGSHTDRNSTIETNLTKNVSQSNNTANVSNSIQQNSTHIGDNKSPTSDSNKQSKEFIYLTLNITNNENHTDEMNKVENSDEYYKEKDNVTALISKRKRRATPSNGTPEFLDLSVKPVIHWKEEKKSDKLLNDSTLSYWPQSPSRLPANTSEDIDALILSSEKRKARFNTSGGILQRNHSMALEKAIFGDADWNDVDTIAPAFASFMGKYVHGLLTFCSDITCHSLNCASASCAHRKCDPAHRYNNIGHCLASGADSIAKMESIMDLPSNLAFEIVDILQEKMLGKMYGKITICIGRKCVTFVATKKTAVKYKCASDEITASSECPFKKTK